MSGDRLAQALHQERSELILAVSGNPVNSAMAWQIIHRWDALVELARALRPFVDEYDFHAADYLANLVDGEEARVFTRRTVDLLIEHQRIARAALARLDSGAAEENA